MFCGPCACPHLTESNFIWYRIRTDVTCDLTHEITGRGKTLNGGQRSCQKVMASFSPSAQMLLAETAFYLTETMASARDEGRVRAGGANPKTTPWAGLRGDWLSAVAQCRGGGLRTLRTRKLWPAPTDYSECLLNCCKRRRIHSQH